MNDEMRDWFRAFLVQLWAITITLMLTFFVCAGNQKAKAQDNPWPLKLMWNEGKGLMEAVRMDTDEVEFWKPRIQGMTGLDAMPGPSVSIGTARLAELSSGGNLTIDLTKDWNTREIVFITESAEFRFTHDNLEKLLNNKTYIATVKVKK